jgi:hypothetical protein
VTNRNRTVDEPIQRDSLRRGITKPSKAIWDEALLSISVDPGVAALVGASSLDWGRRSYCLDGHFLKVVLPSYSTTLAARQQVLRSEGEILESLRGTPGIPEYIEYRRSDTAEALFIEHVSGHSWLDFPHRLKKWLVVFPRLVRLLVSLSWRSVAHGDVKPENVLIDQNGRPWLVDFDQAFRAPPVRSLKANLLGTSTPNAVVQYGLLQFIKASIKSSLSQRVQRVLRAFKRLVRDSSRVPALGPLPPRASERLQLLHRAWQIAADSDANAPGEGVCYYELFVDGFRLPGERSWVDRWAVIGASVDWKDARILELGCNVGLLSTSALLRGADAALGVDADSTILQANALLQQAFGVRYELTQLNFDDPTPWETRLGAFRPTVVTALSVLNWVTDKERFVNFLGRFNTVILEGHDSELVEAERLEKVGFNDIQLIATSERQRPVLIARKATAIASDPNPGKGRYSADPT